jgi:hypothetical protein
MIMASMIEISTMVRLGAGSTTGAADIAVTISSRASPDLLADDSSPVRHLSHLQDRHPPL